LFKNAIVQRGEISKLVLPGAFSLGLRIMALSPQDQKYYEEKLSLRSFSYVFGVMLIIGSISCPLLLYLQDYSAGQAGKWTGQIVFQMSLVGFVLGAVSGTLMYLTFRILLEMGWLPSRN